MSLPEQIDQQEAMKNSLAAELGRQMGMVTSPAAAADADEEFEGILQVASSFAPIPERAAEQKGFDFSPEFQSRVAALLISDETFYRRVDGLVKPEYFESKAEAALVHIAQQYHQRYARLPPTTPDWRELIADAKKQKALRDDDIPDIVASYKTLKKLGLDGRDYVVDKVAEFAKN